MARPHNLATELQEKADLLNTNVPCAASAREKPRLSLPLSGIGGGNFKALTFPEKNRLAAFPHTVGAMSPQGMEGSTWQSASRQGSLVAKGLRQKPYEGTSGISRTMPA